MQSIQTYELCLILAVVVCFAVGPVWAAHLEGLRPRRVIAVLALLGITAFGGAHLHYAARHWAAFAAEPMRFLYVWRGLHAAGAIAAIVVALPCSARLLGVPVGRLADGLLPTMAVGTVIARIGCFLNGCCRGSACAWFWCVVYPDGRVPVHPLPLYFAALGIVTMLVALSVRRRRRFAGEAALTSGLVFAIGMAVLEAWREDGPTRSYWAGIPQHAWLAGGLALLLATALWVARRGSGRASGMTGRDGMARIRSFGRLTTLVLGASLGLGSASARAEVLTFSDSAPGPRGTTVPITFAGDLVGSRITGVLSVGELMVSVDAKAEAERVSGAFRWNGGVSAGTFSGTVSGDAIAGTYVIDGASGRWSVPVAKIPVAVRTALDSPVRASDTP